MTTAKRYELRVGEQALGNLSEGDVAELFHSGRVSPSTACRLRGHTEWQDVNEYLPLLKYGLPARKDTDSYREFPRRAGYARSSWTTEWKVGVSCFAAGLFCAGAVAMLPRTAIPSETPQRRGIPVVRAEPLHRVAESHGASLQAQSTSGLGRIAQTSAPRVQTVSLSSSPAVQGGSQNRIAASPPVTSKPVVKVQEASVALGKWTTVKSGYGSFRVKIREEGPEALSVWLDHADKPRRIKKESFGLAGSNNVEIHSLPGAKVYYEDRLGGPIGRCVLKVIKDT